MVYEQSKTNYTNCVALFIGPEFIWKFMIHHTAFGFVASVVFCLNGSGRVSVVGLNIYASSAVLLVLLHMHFTNTCLPTLMLQISIFLAYVI